MEESIYFYKISPEKQRSILNAGFYAFARNGYQKASMNDVAREAGISKPSLFHYFGTKKDFYLFLFRFACRLVREEMQEGSEDFFDCLWLAMDIKAKLLSTYPGIHAFLITVIREQSVPLLREIQADSYQQFEQASELLFKNVNWDKFKPELTRKQIYHLVSYTDNGVVRDHAGESPEIIMAELKPLLLLLKPALYREEYM